MSLIIKTPTLNELEQINQIVRLSKGHWGYDEIFLNRFMENFSVTKEYLERNTSRIACIYEQLIGFYSFSIQADGSLELDNFFLHPSQIGKGLGRKLWVAYCDTAKELGKHEFTLWADPNTESFYLKVGCEKIGVRQSPMMPDRYPPVMRCKISN